MQHSSYAHALHGIGRTARVDHNADHRDDLRRTGRATRGSQWASLVRRLVRRAPETAAVDTAPAAAGP